MAETASVPNADGGVYLPATQRPDGTWRKARRVKDGYVPQEEVPLYESRGKQWAKSKPIGPLGLHPDDLQKVIQAKNNEGESVTSKSAKKRAKKKQNKELKQEQELSEKLNQVLSVDSPKQKPSAKQVKIQDTNKATTTDPAKRLKNLRKKLHEIEMLDKKIKSGEVKNPEKDQLEKLSRRSEIETEICDLEEELS